VSRLEHRSHRALPDEFEQFVFAAALEARAVRGAGRATHPLLRRFWQKLVCGVRQVWLIELGR
jgi:hypothetical protein